MSMGSEARDELICNIVDEDDNYYELDSKKWYHYKWCDMTSHHIINVFNYLRKYNDFLVIDRELYSLLAERDLAYLIKKDDEIN